MRKCKWLTQRETRWHTMCAVIMFRSVTSVVRLPNVIVYKSIEILLLCCIVNGNVDTWHLDCWTVDVRPWGSMDAGTRHMPWPFCFSLRRVLTFLPQKHVVTHIYTHSRKERQYITYLRDHIHIRTTCIYFLKVNYIEIKYTSTLWPNATGMYASLPLRRVEPQNKQTNKR